MPAGDFPYGYGMFPVLREDAPSGWRCPGCRRCYAPIVPACSLCGPQSELEALATRGCAEMLDEARKFAEEALPLFNEATSYDFAADRGEDTPMEGA